MGVRPQDVVRDYLVRPLRTVALLPRRVSLRNTERVFAIGLSKTGTSSLTKAMRHLGYRTKHFPIEMIVLRGDVLILRPEEAAVYECLTDTPVAYFYRELDQRFPGAKFILTVRDLDGWLKSCKTHFVTPSWGKRMDRLHTELYGSRVFDRISFADGYQRHVAGVYEYFQDRPSDLLVLDIGQGDGWDELCPFLGVPVPDIPFPWVNRTRAPVDTDDRPRPRAE